MDPGSSTPERDLVDRVKHRVQAAGHDISRDDVVAVVRRVLRQIEPAAARDTDAAHVHVFVVETGAGPIDPTELRTAVSVAAERCGGRLLAHHTERLEP